MILSGWPEKRENAMPHTEPATMHSIVAMSSPVFLPSMPPNATSEQRHTRYMYSVVARHCRLNTSVKSLT